METKRSFSAYECRFIGILWLQFDLVIRTAKIKYSQPFRAIHGVETGVGSGQRVCIFTRHIVEPTVVDATAEGAVLLLHENDVGSPSINQAEFVQVASVTELPHSHCEA